MRALLVVVCGLVACKPHETEFHRVELPGFSMELPTFVEARPGLAYRGTSIEATDTLGSVAIAWQPGEIAGVDELAEAVQPRLVELGKGEQHAGPIPVSNRPVARAVTIGGQSATQLDVRLGIRDVTFASITCGRRHVMIELVDSGITNLRDRALSSFQCKPDLEADKHLQQLAPIRGDNPLVLHGFRFYDERSQRFNITNDRFIAWFYDVAQYKDRDVRVRLEHFDEARKLVEKHDNRFEPAGDTVNLALPTGDRPFDPIWLKQGSQKLPGIRSFWVCGADRVMMGVVIVKTEEERDLAMRWLAKIQCAKPGDPPLAIAPEQPDESDAKIRIDEP